MNSNDFESPATKYIPYTVPLDAHTCATSDWDVLRTIQLQGVPFETLSVTSLNALSSALLTTWNTLAARSTRAAMWTHLIRRKINYDFSTIEYDNYFSDLFNKQYGGRMAKEDFFINELYVTPVYRPAANDFERYAQRLSRDQKQKREMHHAGLIEIEKITTQLMASMRRYHPTLLSTTETEEGDLLSQSAQLYARILNGGDGGPVAVNRYAIKHAIQRSDISFLGDMITIDRPDSTRYAAILTLKAPYSVEKVRTNLLHGLLQLPCEFILSQSLTFLPNSKAEKYLKIQLDQIKSTSGNKIQIKELEDAIALVQNGKFSMGQHEFTMTIYGDSPRELNAAVSETLAELEQRSIEVVRETRGALIAQYFGMLPGNFTTGRVRAQPISTNNFVSFFPMHNYFTGNATGSQWGMPITMLKGAGGAPYFYNYHVPRQTLKEQNAQLEYQSEQLVHPVEHVALDSDHDSGDDEDDEEEELIVVNGKRQRKESGNFLLIGPNGSGKTAVQCALRAAARKKSIALATRLGRLYKSFTFDKDNGQEIFTLAMGGAYFRFLTGEYAGINHFSLPKNRQSIMFILKTARWCAEQDANYKLGADDEKRLLASIEEVYELPIHMRRWSRIMDTLEVGSPLASALSRYCAGGPYAWVLDSEVDRFDFDIANDFGFDMTEFLQDAYACVPILSYLKYKIDTNAPGSPHSIELDEASTALRDPYLAKQFIEDGARTVRKKDGIIGLSFQDASDATEGPLAGVLTTQFPAMMIFPNGQAERKYFIDGLKLTEQEFLQVKSGMHDKAGKFLLKRGTESTVVQLDLSGMNEILSVVSGSSDNLPLVRELVEQLGNNPAVWLPEFFKRRV
jgi:type IV secretion system protein VirB4